jgi:hypothetical protein
MKSLASMRLTGVAMNMIRIVATFPLAMTVTSVLGPDGAMDRLAALSTRGRDFAAYQDRI